MLPYVAGVVVSIGVALFARRVGLDRDRAFYPTVLIVVASYYVLFAAMSGSIPTMLLESALMALFAGAAVAGFKRSPWIIVVGLAAHGVQDAFHGHLVANAGAPAWWPAWCLAYDVGAAGALAWILTRECVRYGAGGIDLAHASYTHDDDEAGRRASDRAIRGCSSLRGGSLPDHLCVDVDARTWP